jgi:dynein heavy chain 1
MDFTTHRALGSLFSVLNQGVRNVLHYNHTHMDFPMNSEQLEQYTSKFLVQAILWSFTGDSKAKFRDEMSGFIRSVATVQLPPNTSQSILDYEVRSSRCLGGLKY